MKSLEMEEMHKMFKIILKPSYNSVVRCTPTHMRPVKQRGT